MFSAARPTTRWSRPGQPGLWHHPPPDIYFPYASKAQSEQTFRASSRIDRCIPGLSVSRPDVYERIISYQHFVSPENEWLPVFMDLCTENKHQRLSPQTRSERKELRISSRGSTAAFGEGASVTLGPGASMKVGDLTIRGPQGFDASNPPSATGNGRLETIIWVSFNFTDGDIPVLPLRSSALIGARRIVEELSTI